MVIYNGERDETQALTFSYQAIRWEGLAAWAGCYEAILCDVWGVVHNGVRPYAGAIHALSCFRRLGGRVVLISNAPRPSFMVEEQFRRIGVSGEAFDYLLTSGDMTRSALRGRVYGERYYHLGPGRDRGLFDDRSGLVSSVERADFILCTGLLDDEREDVEVYHAFLSEAVRRRRRMICANPDIVVERDGRLIPCAGKLARFYEELGGEVIYFGKPHPPIYERARELLGGVPSDKMLAIGDGLLTDIKGAVLQGIDSLFILGGIAGDIEPSDEAVRGICVQNGVMPHGWMRQLVWS